CGAGAASAPGPPPPQDAGTGPAVRGWVEKEPPHGPRPIYSRMRKVHIEHLGERANDGVASEIAPGLSVGRPQALFCRGPGSICSAPACIQARVLAPVEQLQDVRSRHLHRDWLRDCVVEEAPEGNMIGPRPVWGPPERPHGTVRTLVKHVENVC